MKKFYIISILLLAILFSGCATVYKNSEFNQITSEHKVIAILPFDVVIQYKNQSFYNNPDKLSDAEEYMGTYFQEQLYLRFLKHLNRYRIEIQDVSKTNTILKKHYIDYSRMDEFTKEELANILNVDAVVSGKIFTTKPLSTGAAIALELLTENDAVTNEVNVNVSLNERNEGKLLFKYDHTYSGGLGSSPEKLTNSLISDVESKFPYKR